MVMKHNFKGIVVDLKEFAPKVVKRVNSFMENYLNILDNAAPNLKAAMSYGLL